MDNSTIYTILAVDIIWFLVNCALMNHISKKEVERLDLKEQVEQMKHNYNSHGEKRYNEGYYDGKKIGLKGGYMQTHNLIEHSSAKYPKKRKSELLIIIKNRLIEEGNKIK